MKTMLALLVVLVACGQSQSQAPGGGAPTPGSAAAVAEYVPPKVPVPAVVYSVPIDGDPAVGAGDATITLVVGSEYACSYCKQALPVIAALRERYGADLRVVHKQFIVHPTTATAMALAACAAAQQGRFAEMDDALWTKVYDPRAFDESAPVAEAGGDVKTGCWDGSIGCPTLRSLARELQLDMPRFEADVKGTCRRIVEADQRVLTQLGMYGTPGFFVNGRFINGAQPIAVFTALVDEELKKAAAVIASGKASAATYYASEIVAKGRTSAQ